MKKFIYIFIAAAIAAVSCEKEADLIEEVVPGEETNVPQEVQGLTNPITLTFTAGTDTKVSISEEGTAGEKTAVWDENDKIKIVWYSSTEAKAKSVTATANSYGSASTTFTATVEEADHYYAVYPSTLTITLDGSGNFTVNFADGKAAPTQFKDAAWYAAKTTAEAKSFAFKAISTLMKFQIKDTGAEGIYFRSIAKLTKLNGKSTISFIDSDDDGVFEAATTGLPNGNAYMNATVNGAGTYYLTLPATTQTAEVDEVNHYDPGFIIQIKKGTEHIPAAYWSASIQLNPGKLYNLTTAVDDKIIWDYYVSNAGEGTGLSAESYSSITRLTDWANGQPAFRTNTKASALMRDGITVHLKGGETFTSPIAFSMESTIERTVNFVGGYGGGTTTFTTSSSSTFGNEKLTANLRDITFSGCTTAPAVEISAGKVNLNNVNLVSCAAKGINITGGTTTITGGTVKDFNAANNAVVISKEPTVSFDGVTFDNNICTSQNGGPVRIQSGTNDGPVVDFKDCEFTNNSCTKTNGQGAGVYIGTNCKVNFNGCTFDSNTATNGGAVMVAGSSSSTDDNLGISFTKCTFHLNKSTSTTTIGGGAICVGANTAAGKVTFNNCRFANDEASQGAAYYTQSSAAAFFNQCTFYLEKATKTDDTAINGHTIYSNNTAGRLGMNNCTIQALNMKDGEYNAGSNGTTLRSSGYGVIANSTIWSSGQTGKRAMVMVGRGPSVAGSLPGDNTVVNTVIHEKSSNYNAFFIHANYKVQVLYSLIDGFNAVPDGTNQISTGCFDRGKNQTVVGAKNETDKPFEGVNHSYYTYTFNSTTYSGFTPASMTYVANAIKNTNVVGTDFYNWLVDIGAIVESPSLGMNDIMGESRAATMTPGSIEIGGWE